MYPIKTHDQSVVLNYEEIFQHHEKKIIIGTGINTSDEDQCHA